MNKPWDGFLDVWRSVWERVLPVRFARASLTLEPDEVEALGNVLQEAALLPAWAERALLAEAQLSAIREAYREEPGDTAAKQRAACRAAGITRQDGRRRPTYDSLGMAWRYATLRQSRSFRGTVIEHGLTPAECVARLRVEYGRASDDATLKALHDAKKLHPVIADVLGDLPDRRAGA